MDAAQRVATARHAAQTGGTVALDLFRGELSVEQKGEKTDVVTRADREVQAATVGTIRDVYPEDAVVGEEDDESSVVPDEGAVWIVDPIDGTSNYVRGIRVWATSVAAVVDGDPVAAVTDLPALGDTYIAGPRGVVRNGRSLSVSDRSDPQTFAVAPAMWWDFERRDEYAAATREIVERFGDLVRLRCSQATLAHLAAGGIDAAVTNVGADPWDTVAGAYMIERAGGTVTDLDGEAWSHDSAGLVASNGECHDEALAAARAVAAVADGTEGN